MIEKQRSEEISSKGSDEGRDRSPAENAGGPATPPARQRSILVTLLTNFCILGLTVITGTLNARLLGPAGRGELAAIQTIPSAFATLALLGLPGAVGYFSARRPDEVRAFTLTGVALGLMASLPAMFAGFLLMPRALSSQTASVVHDARLYLAFVALQAVVLLPYMALLGLGKFGAWNILRLAPNVATLAAIAIAWASGTANAGIFSRRFLVMYGLIAPLTYATLWSKSRRGPARGGVHSNTHRARELLKFGLPGALMVPAGLLNLQLDQMMMAAWLPSKLLGLYAVGVSWSGLISPAFGALGSIVFPTLAASREPDVQRVLVARTLRFAVLVVAILGLGLAAVTPILLPAFFGRSFAPAVPSALILVAAGVVLNLNNLCGEILRGLAVPRWPLYGQIVALPITISLLLWLLPRWSIVGAGVSSLVAYAVATLVSVAGIRKTVGLTAKELLLPKRDDFFIVLRVVRGAVARLRG